MCLAQGPQRSDAGEAPIHGPSVSSQALYHSATHSHYIALEEWFNNGILGLIALSGTTNFGF